MLSAFSNTLLNTVRRIFAIAMEEGYRTDNPAAVRSAEIH
jgi:hypothetical protein